MSLGMIFSLEEIHQICNWINIKYIIADLSTWIREENMYEQCCGKSIIDIQHMNNDELEQWLFEYQTDPSMQHFFYNNIEYLIETFHEKVEKKCNNDSDEEQSTEEIICKLLRGTSYIDNLPLFFKLADYIHPFSQIKMSVLLEFAISMEKRTWEKDHAQEIAEFEQQLKRLQAEILDAKEKLIDVRSRKAAIEAELREKEALAEGVEKRIADRIAAAKQDAAQFISDMAFCSTTAVSQQINTSVVSDGIQAEVDRTIVLDNPDDLLDHMQYELGAAGVDDEYSLHLAAFLYSAYCNKTPLLLAGPNAAQIANAFAVCMTGMTAVAVDCNQDYAANWTDDIAAQHTDIVVFRNPFRHDWIHPILEQLETPERFYILLHPFAEDLCIEPAGLMNYVLPVLTDAFVTGKAAGIYTGAEFSDNFTHYQPSKPDIRLHSAELKKLVSQSILRSNIQQILTDAHKLVPEMNDDMDMLLGLIPAAYVYAAQTATAARTFCPPSPVTAHGHCPANYDILGMARQ